MTMQEFVYSSRMPVPAEALAQWHEAPGAFERLTPPWERVEVVERSGGIRDGDRVTVRLHVGPFRLRWELVHECYEAGRQFQDRQVRGPFAAWVHTHRFLPDGPDQSILEDRIRYRLPLGLLGRLLGSALTRRRLLRLFEFRHRVTKEYAGSGDRSHRGRRHVPGGGASTFPDQ